MKYGSCPLTYRPDQFADMFESPLGISLWAFITSPTNQIRMETACDLKRTAAEALVYPLVLEFGDAIRQPRMKRMIGHMIRQVMEQRGFKLEQKNVRVRTGDVFVRASRYVRVDHSSLNNGCRND